MTLALVAFQRHVVKRTGSVAISADELHYRSDILLNSSVILALVLWMTLGWRAIDPLFGAAIGCFILYSAYAIVQLAMAGLMDREHDLRTRASGPSAFIQLHLEMDGQLTLDHAHRIADEVEGQIRAAFPQAEVIIHEDPVGIDEQRQVFTQRR
jgi:ferrous-iron efflux pump FieF